MSYLDKTPDSVTVGHYALIGYTFWGMVGLRW